MLLGLFGSYTQSGVFADGLAGVVLSDQNRGSWTLVSGLSDPFMNSLVRGRVDDDRGISYPKYLGANPLAASAADAYGFIDCDVHEPNTIPAGST